MSCVETGSLIKREKEVATPAQAHISIKGDLCYQDLSDTLICHETLHEQEHKHVKQVSVGKG